VKRIVSALLICLLFFNWFGYNLVVNYLQQQSDFYLEASLDKNQYNDADLIELKIAIKVPYQNSWPTYERYDGEIEMKGITYKYVKRKVFNDTLYLMCIPNTAKMNLETSRNDFFKNSIDLGNTTNSEKSKSLSFKKVTDYDENVFHFHSHLSNKGDNFYLSYEVNYLPTSPHISPEQPPDFS